MRIINRHTARMCVYVLSPSAEDELRVTFSKIEPRGRVHARDLCADGTAYDVDLKSTRNDRNHKYKMCNEAWTIIAQTRTMDVAGRRLKHRSRSSGSPIELSCRSTIGSREFDSSWCKTQIHFVNATRSAKLESFDPVGGLGILLPFQDVINSDSRDLLQAVELAYSQNLLPLRPPILRGNATSRSIAATK